jgi:pimeloyl-ACP methyl ester carboxylesterase
VKDFAESVDEISVRYETRGSGTPALVFVHGWSCDRSYWSHQLGHFAKRSQVVAVDLVGHGESGAGRPSSTMKAFGADVAAVVEKLGLRDIVLIGHSMGGDVIAEAALQLPGRVRGLIWVDVYGFLGAPRTPEEIDQFEAPFRADFVTATRELVRGMFPPGADPKLVEWVVFDMSAAPPEIALDALHHSIRNDGPIVERLRELTLPVVAINPDDGSTDIESLERYGVNTVLVPGVGHFLMMEDPDAFNVALGEAIDAMGKQAPLMA